MIRIERVIGSQFHENGIHRGRSAIIVLCQTNDCKCDKKASNWKLLLININITARLLELGDIAFVIALMMAFMIVFIIIQLEWVERRVVKSGK